jgi:hypothetical protein
MHTGPREPADMKAPNAAATPAISSGVSGAPTRPLMPDTLTIRPSGMWTGKTPPIVGSWSPAPGTGVAGEVSPAEAAGVNGIP